MAKILLVEDDTPLLRLYEGALLEQHEVVAVESTKTAIRALEDYHPDVMVLDLNLPDAPGTVILQHLDANPQFADVQVVVMTGFAYYKNQNLPDAVKHVLSKPVTSSMLLRTVNMVVGSKTSV